MGGINVKRWLAGGVAAGVLIWIFEGAASVLYMDTMRVAMEAHGLSMDITAGQFAITVVVSLMAGLALVFFYAAARPRFGPGPKTAIIIAAALCLGGYFLSILGYGMLGLFPNTMLALWGIVGLAEVILAGLLGAWIYREGGPRPSAVT